MTNSTQLNLPFIAAAQSAKHVTHNDALLSLDALVFASVKDRNLATPPVSPAAGDRYIVAGSPTGAWSGYAGYIAAYQDSAWRFYAPKTGWLCWVEDEALLVVYAGSAWGAVPTGAAGLTTACGATTGTGMLEELVTVSSGSYVDSSIAFPTRSIMLCCACRTVTNVTGASSYNCGIAGDTSKFGGTLSISAGATNIGVIGPTAVYASTPVRLSANGSNFTGGTIRVSLSYLSFGAATS
jgi:hypothetical protein